jgi:ABC-2 type transport system permease protein
VGKENKTPKKGLRAVLVRELKRMSSQQIYMWILFILPLFSFLLFTTMFHEGKAEGFSIAVFDADNTALSRQIKRWVEATPEIEIKTEVNSLEAGKRLIEKSEIRGVLYIPKETESGIYRGDANKLVLFYSNTNLSAGSSVSVATMKAIGTLSAGINLQKRMAHTEMYEQAFTNIQPIVVDTHALYNPYINYAYYLVTALLPVMLLMFIISATIFSIGTELKYSTAKEWFETSGESIIVALTGKLLPYSFVFIIEAFFINTILFKYMHAPMNGNLFVIFISTIFFVFAYQAMGVFIISVFPNVRLSLSLGAAYSSLAFSFAGLTFPTVAMGTAMQYFSEIFPYTHYLRIYINEAMKGLDLRFSLPSFWILAIFISLPFFLIPRLRKFLTNKKYWGKI